MKQGTSAGGVVFQKLKNRLLSADVFASFSCLAFLVICFYYSSKINLWGDEAYSLQLAEKSWQQILTTVDVHLPTYYFFLKILVFLFGDSKEIALRLLHSILFSVGLFLGYKTIFLFSKSPKKSLLVLLASVISPLVLLASVISPTFVFYATNLRMYASLFLFSMGYIFILSSIFIKNGLPTKKDWIIYFIAAICLVLIDYPGIILFLIGSALMLFKFFKLRKFNYIFLSLLPITLLLIYYPRFIPEINNILTWRISSGPQISIGMSKAGIFELAKVSYNVFRPVFDLFSPSQKYLLLALIFPFLFAFGLFLSLPPFLIKQIKQLNLNIFIVACFAFYWFVSVPFGGSLTRSFLPSLFFMPAFLLLASPWLPRKVVGLNIILFTFLVLINLPQVLNPTLRLYSTIPYKVIASDLISTAEKENINQILFSDNSLNNLSIKRYVEKGDGPRFGVSWISPNSKGDLSKQSNFLFVSHMGENGKYVDYKMFTNDYQVTNVKNYIRLDDLPYNSFWLKQIKERAFQDYAVSVYLVHKK